MEATLLQARQVIAHFVISYTQCWTANLPLHRCAGHVPDEAITSLRTYRRCARWRALDQSRCPNMRRLDAFVRHWRRMPHDHPAGQSKARPQVRDVGPDVWLLHGEDNHHGHAHRMGHTAHKYTSCYRSSGLCGRRGATALHHQPPVRATNLPGPTPQFRMASSFPLCLHLHLRPHRGQPHHAHHIRRAKLLHPKQQHQTN